MNTTGQVMSLEGDGAEVRVGSFGVRVQCSELERRAPLEAASPESAKVPAAVLMDSQPALNVELDLRGQRVEEALPRVDKHLDDAFLAGMPRTAYRTLASQVLLQLLFQSPPGLDNQALVDGLV